tara:strand:+ start:1122 stop:1853 length:732 start_codon:yes stop_codon:yes gene_type:complete
MSRSNGWINSIYNSYEELKDSTGTYDNIEWINKQKYRVENFEKEKDISISRNSLLINFVNSLKKDCIRIVDYGGGFGLSYLPLVASTDKKINYHIVEVPGVSSAAAKLYSDNEDISFYSSFSDLKNLDFDIGYIRTSLQYAKDWSMVLESMTNLSPENIILSDASIGEIETFLTFQAWGCEKIPYWFINERDLIDKVTSKNYKVSMREVARDISQESSWKTQRDYPVKYRIDCLINLIFSRVL